MPGRAVDVTGIAFNPLRAEASAVALILPGGAQMVLDFGIGIGRQCFALAHLFAVEGAITGLAALQRLALGIGEWLPAGAGGRSIAGDSEAACGSIKAQAAEPARVGARRSRGVVLR